MSISLWDLHELVGLPMAGCLYDEVVPSALELTGVDEKRERFIPRSCKYLLYAYHLLQNADDNRCSHVSIDKWVKFWSKKTTKYHPPPPRKEKKTVRPKSTHNLLVILQFTRDVNFIRPSTFKMASLMANGRRVNLDIPVLASIYEGLNTVATSQKPAKLRGPKMTRFSGEGGAKYYEPREARKRIHKAEFVSWACNMLVKAEQFKFVDDGRAEELDHSYFVAIRSSYLTLRRGGRFIVEPYSPHRFGRQFGPKSIKITLKRKKDEDKQVDGGKNDPPHALIPPIVIECDSQAAVVELEDEVQSIDVGEEYETSHSSTMTPPLGMGLKRKQSSPPAAVSVLKGESFLFNYQKEFLQRLWGGLIVKISNTPVDFLSSIEDDVHLILESVKSFQKFDISKVEESLNMFFAKVRAYDEARSLSSEKLSQSLHEQQLKEVKARLQDVQAKASEEASEIQSVMDELEHVEEDIAVLKGQRTNLRATLKEKKQLNHDTQAKVHEVEKDLAALESTAPLDDAIVQNLESSRANLGILTEDLKSLNPFA
ncbi:UNVERIFIED_CONTAM: hypothetical protein Scaly_3028100 [Sesamum calycinum]|uniref:Uncharacterized protein n=1 Tax=Sesamum calycinum TaxID=2727403 RepID=A0AAW2K6M0_9LAMI